jgi:hypothetical protein
MKCKHKVTRCNVSIRVNNAYNRGVKDQGKLPHINVTEIIAKEMNTMRQKLKLENDDGDGGGGGGGEGGGDDGYDYDDGNNIEKSDKVAFPKRVLNGNLHTTRPVGRPRTRWADLVQRDALRLLGIRR